MKQNRKIYNLILGLVICLFCFAGCSNEAADEAQEELVIVDNASDTIAYTMATCERTNIEVTSRVNASYVQSKDQKVALSEGGQKIVRVCVKEGDTVKKGDLLISLDAGNLDEEIENLKYQIKQEKLKSEQIEKEKEFSLASTYYGYVFGSGLESEDDVKAYEKSKADVEKDFRYQKEDNADSIEFDEAKLKELEAKKAKTSVYSQMDGLVYKIEKDLQGSTTRKDQVIMTIVDGSSGYFVAKDQDILEGLNTGDVVRLNITHGDGSGDYELTPMRRNEWGEEQYFSILTAPENSVLEVGITGTLYVITDSKENVLSVPTRCVHKAGDEYYVYVLDDSGLKQVRYVEIGLSTTDITEIISGLDEGEQIVKK